MVKKIAFIGDVHGKFHQYHQIISNVDESYQVGDMGIGFKDKEGRADAPVYSMGSNHFFIRGNHDNPETCKKNPRCIPDGTVKDHPILGTIMFIGGASSIDAHLRTEGVDWWRDEENSYEDFQKFIDVYMEAKPDIMITHDCPESVSDILFPWKQKDERAPLTRNAFDHMFAQHKPKAWIFGHWHHDVSMDIENTRFICLDELSYFVHETRG